MSQTTRGRDKAIQRRVAGAGACSHPELLRAVRRVRRGRDKAAEVDGDLTGEVDAAVDVAEGATLLRLERVVVVGVEGVDSGPTEDPERVLTMVVKVVYFTYNGVDETGGQRAGATRAWRVGWMAIENADGSACSIDRDENATKRQFVQLRWRRSEKGEGWVLRSQVVMTMTAGATTK